MESPGPAALTPPPAGAVRAPLSRPDEPPARCVCYGLGRFGRCPAARDQLAFLLLLLDELRVSPGTGGSPGTAGREHRGWSAPGRSRSRRAGPVGAARPLCPVRPGLFSAGGGGAESAGAAPDPRE